MVDVGDSSLVKSSVYADRVVALDDRRWNRKAFSRLSSVVRSSNAFYWAPRNNNNNNNNNNNYYYYF